MHILYLLAIEVEAGNVSLKHPRMKASNEIRQFLFITISAREITFFQTRLYSRVFHSKIMHKVSNEYLLSADNTLGKEN
jgi:hypothetical protein